MAVLISLSLSFLHRLSLYFQLTKPRLSIVVVFSAVMGALVAGLSDIWQFLWLILGGYALTGSANAANQIWERESDALMERTRHRPLPMGLLSVMEATIFTFILFVIAVLLLFKLRWGVALLGIIAWVLYVFAYTPLKRHGVIAVVVGAVAGALPPVIGYWAVRDQVTSTLAALFLLQFAWQFPHFWVIAWLARADYEKAHFRMLPFPAQRLRENAWAIGMAILLLPTLSLLLIPFLPWRLWLWTFVLGVVVTAFAGYQLWLTSQKAMRYLLLSLTAYLILLYLGLWLLI
ncbi:MAG: protoheme IX farnesyltransferase [Bacteroidia bacterium]|nr:protoheme IX farnesyltransferase [Bacteroidia bacterium]MDW8057030.1 protoheme IX farnesyltransferase [Bacteroidia bacterium]